MQQLNYMLDICRATHRARVGVIYEYAKINLRNRAYTTCILLNVSLKISSFILFIFKHVRKVPKNDY